MSPELEKEIIVGLLSAFLTAVFTGVPAILLVWWTWQRDQERVTVQKLIPFAKTVEGKRVRIRDQSGPEFGILIRNRSLFSVHISAVGFQIDDEVVQLEHPYFPSRMKRNPDELSNRPYIADPDYNPRELPSQACVQVSVLDPTDRTKLSTVLLSIAEKRGVSTDDLLMSGRVIALVALESGRIFSSLPFGRRFWRRVLELKREMDGQISPST